MRILLVASLFTLTSIAAIQQRPPATARISGEAIDALTDRPLPSVLVHIGELEVMTNPQGQFTVENIPQGKHALVATADGYMVGRLGKEKAASNGITLSLKSGDEIVGLKIYLAPAGAISGQLLDGNGQAVSNAEVIALPYNYDYAGNLVLAGSKNPGSGFNLLITLLAPAGIHPLPDVSRIHKTIRTDDRGQYRIYNLDPGAYGIVTRAPSSNDAIYYPGVSVPGDAERVVVESGHETRLRPLLLKQTSGAALLIRIDDRPGGRSSFRGVILRHKGGMDVLQMPLSGVRALSGIKLLPGRYEAEGITGNAGPPLSLAAAKIDFEIRDTDREIVIPAPRGVALRGTVAAEIAGATRPLPNVSIVVGSSEVMPSFTANLTSDASGTFSAASFPTGLFHVFSIQGIPEGACVRDFRQNDRNVLLDGLDVSDPPVRFQVNVGEPMSVVRGYLRDTAGAPIQGGNVVLVPEDSRRKDLFATTVSDWKGGFELMCLHPGSYRIFSWLELNGAPYFNPDFMKAFEGAGRKIQLEQNSAVEVDGLSPLEN